MAQVIRTKRTRSASIVPIPPANERQGKPCGILNRWICCAAAKNGPRSSGGCRYPLGIRFIKAIFHQRLFIFLAARSLHPPAAPAPAERGRRAAAGRSRWLPSIRRRACGRRGRASSVSRVSGHGACDSAVRHVDAKSQAVAVSPAASCALYLHPARTRARRPSPFRTSTTTRARWPRSRSCRRAVVLSLYRRRHPRSSWPGSAGTPL